MSVYIDTSLLVAYYSPELGSKAAESYLIKQEGLAISLLTQVEFASAVRKKVRSKEIRKEDANNIIKDFQTDIRKKYYELLPVIHKDYQRAESLLIDFDNNIGLRALDALHIAIAEREKRVLATADKQLAESAKRLGVKTDYIRF